MFLVNLIGIGLWLNISNRWVIKVLGLDVYGVLEVYVVKVIYEIF